MSLPNFTDDERRALLKALAALDQDGLEVILFAELGDSVASFGALTMPMPLLSVRFIQWIAPHPANLKIFLDAFVAKFSALDEVPVLQAQAARLAQLATHAAVDPVEACLIDAAIMVNRGRLRAILRTLVAGHIRPLIVVTGERYSGRSHSWHLIRHVARAHGIPARRIDLGSWVLEERTLDRLFDRLVADLVLTHAERPTAIGAQPETRGARYADEIADCLDRLPPAPHAQWLVFDSVDRPMTSEIAAFLRRLSEKRLRADFRDCTIFLLGEGDQLRIEQAGLVDRENLSSLVEREIAEAAMAINSMGTQKLADTAVQTRVDSLMADLAAASPEKALETVGRKLNELRLEVTAP